MQMTFPGGARGGPRGPPGRQEHLAKFLPLGPAPLLGRQSAASSPLVGRYQAACRPLLGRYEAASKPLVGLF